MTLPPHGSNPDYLYQSMGISRPGLSIDFSANINPLGPPPSLHTRWEDAFRLITDYPDPGGRQFIEKAAAKEGVPADWILPGNGGAELITLAARMLAGKKVMIIQPAFSEYENACKASGCSIGYHILEEGSWELDLELLLPKLRSCDALFLCNPNNPTGHAFAETSVMTVLEECKKNNCFVIIDEAFYDFLPDEKTYASIIKNYPNLLILRSLTKMYSIPGLRLGYLIAHPSLVQTMSAFQPHWSVNSLALMAGEVCLNSAGYVLQTQQYIIDERRKLMQFFKENGFAASNSQVNFYLVKDLEQKDQLPILRFLLEKGIVPRHTYNFPGLAGRWLRLAVKQNSDNKKLMEVLAAWRQDH